MPLLRTTPGQIAVNAALPEELRDSSRQLDKATLTALLREVAQKYPEHYRAVSHRLATIGHQVAQEFGSHSFGLAHLRKSPASRRIQDKLHQRLRDVLNDDQLTDDQRHAAIVKRTGAAMKEHVDAIYDESVRAGNPLAAQIWCGD